MDKSTKQKISKKTQTLNYTVDQLDLIDIYTTFHPKMMNFTFSSSAHGTFCRIDNILGHKSSLGKFKKIEIISSIFSIHNVVRLDVKYRKKKLENSAVATRLEKVNFHFNPKERQCQRMLKLRHNCTHLTC